MSDVRIGIIGGKGAMGKWFESFFTRSGRQVMISDLDTRTTFEDIVRNCDVIMLSVPLDAAGLVASEVGPLLSENQCFTDVCSLKEDVMEAMMNHSRSEVVGTHPLFGPFRESIKGQNVIICPGRGEKWLDWLETEFESNGAVVRKMDPATHDKNMAIFQGITHLLSISLGRMLQKMNMKPADMISMSTPVFRVNLDLIGRLFAQDLRLYNNIIGKNRYIDDVIDVFSSAMNEGRNLLLADDETESLLFLEGVRGFLGDFCRHGLEESNAMFEHLFESTIDRTNK